MTEDRKVDFTGTPPEIELPFGFGREKKDAAEWVYDHRISLSITIIVYLLLAIIFVSTKIILDRPERSSEIIVQFEDMEKLERELQRAQELNRLLNEDYIVPSSIRNTVSNENASESADKVLADPASDEMYKRSQELFDEVRANRDMYEEGLRQQREMEEAARREAEAAGQRQDVKVAGRVTVSFSFRDPVRTSLDLYVPAYKCESGGTVVVNVVLDRSGLVTSASVDKDLSRGADNCMTTTAVDAAQRSRFARHDSAPAKHHGSITYTFVPQ